MRLWLRIDLKEFEVCYLWYVHFAEKKWIKVLLKAIQAAAYDIMVNYIGIPNQK